MGHQDHTLMCSTLNDGESVIWSGHPRSRFALARMKLFQGLFGIYFVVFTLGWIDAVVQGRRNNWDHGRKVPPFAAHNVLIAAVPTVVGLPLGMAAALSPLFAWWRAGRTRYLLTDHRALVVQVDAKRFRILHDFRAEALADMEIRIRSDGSGDLIFGKQQALVKGMTHPIGFLCVENADEVAAIVRKQLSRPPTPRLDPASHLGHSGDVPAS